MSVILCSYLPVLAHQCRSLQESCSLLEGTQARLDTPARLRGQHAGASAAQQETLRVEMNIDDHTACRFMLDPDEMQMMVADLSIGW